MSIITIKTRALVTMQTKKGFLYFNFGRNPIQFALKIFWNPLVNKNTKKIFTRVVMIRGGTKKVFKIPNSFLLSIITCGGKISIRFFFFSEYG